MDVTVPRNLASKQRDTGQAYRDTNLGIRIIWGTGGKRTVTNIKRAFVTILPQLEIHKKNNKSVLDLFYRAECIITNLEKPPTGNEFFCWRLLRLGDKKLMICNKI